MSDTRNWSAEDWAHVIRQAVADPRLADVVVRRVALAVADGVLSRSRIEELLRYIADGRRTRTIARPGAYFVTCAKELFAQSNVPWSTATPVAQQGGTFGQKETDQTAKTVVQDLASKWGRSGGGET